MDGDFAAYVTLKTSVLVARAEPQRPLVIALHGRGMTERALERWLRPGIDKGGLSWWVPRGPLPQETDRRRITYAWYVFNGDQTALKESMDEARPYLHDLVAMARRTLRPSSVTLFGFSPSSPIASGSHTAHVVDANLACGKCHSRTVGTSSDNVIAGYDNHVNGRRDVWFSPEVGGTFNAADNTCSSTYCHGTTSPSWTGGVVSGCAVCHQDMGPGNGYTFTGQHRTHTDIGLSGSDTGYKIACEMCHSFNSVGQTRGSHGGGDNSAGPRTVQVLFTDNGSAQTYNGKSYFSDNLWRNPYGFATAPTPSYAENGAFVSGDNDAVNAKISWSRGTCGNVWCHSNANPYPGGVVCEPRLLLGTWFRLSCLVLLLMN